MTNRTGKLAAAAQQLYILIFCKATARAKGPWALWLEFNDKNQQQ